MSLKSVLWHHMMILPNSECFILIPLQRNSEQFPHAPAVIVFLCTCFVKKKKKKNVLGSVFQNIIGLVIETTETQKKSFTKDERVNALRASHRVRYAPMLIAVAFLRPVRFISALILLPAWNFGSRRSPVSCKPLVKAVSVSAVDDSTRHHVQLFSLIYFYES